jgi:phenylacetate-CoA ligase
MDPRYAAPPDLHAPTDRAIDPDELLLLDSINHPTLSSAGRETLTRLRQHPHAPHFRNYSGSRLSEQHLELARVESVQARTAPVPATGEEPFWVDGFIAELRTSVPYFRDRIWSHRLADIATTSRYDLSRSVLRFIPDSVDAAGLIVYETSGVTGHPLTVPSHPLVAARYLAYHQRALDRVGVSIPTGPQHTAVLLLGYQKTCFTYASVVPLLDEAGLAKINLHPDDWRTPSDRAKFIDDVAPSLLTGDPVSFQELLNIETQHRPEALLSTSMALSTGLRYRLQDRFGCPVLDLYSLNEAGPVAVFDQNYGGHVLLQDRLHVEIVDPSGHVVPEGERGEITLTGGFNHCLPLLRYRTGDFASITTVTPATGDPARVLMDLTGRAPVRFRCGDGTWINNHEIGHAIARFAFAQFSFHQHQDGSATLFVDGPQEASTDAANHLSSTLHLTVTAQPSQIEPGVKLMQYTSDIPEGLVQ